MANVGKIKQIIGAVVDVAFPHGELPQILNALTVTRENGQKLVLERICNNWNDKERKSIALYVTHNFKDDTKDIPLVDCMVEKYYFAGTWHSTNYPLKDTLNRLGKNWNIKKLKI